MRHLRARFDVDAYAGDFEMGSSQTSSGITFRVYSSQTTRIDVRLYAKSFGAH